MPCNLSSARNPSMNFTCIRWSGPPHCATRKPSRWSSCVPPASAPSGFTFMTAPKWTSTATTTRNRSGRTRAMARCQTEANRLGIPLPKGKLRFYRSDTDGHLEFVGENTIDHTPKDETIRVYTGNAFDVVGERKRTNFHVESNQHWMDESFEIRVRNHKKEAVNVRVVEHLYRGINWKLADQSQQSRKMDAQTVEFPVSVAADGEAVVTYTVHYSW